MQTTFEPGQSIGILSCHIVRKQFKICDILSHRDGQSEKELLKRERGGGTERETERED